MFRVKVLVREGDSRDVSGRGFREQILWEDSGRFVVTSRVVGGVWGLDETMAFPASAGGDIIDNCELAAGFGVPCIHEQLAKSAFESGYWERTS